MKSKSFALIMVLLVTAFLSFLSISIVQKLSILLDISIERNRFYKSFYLAEHIFEIELNLIKKRFEGILEKVSLQPKPIFLNCSLLLKGYGSENLEAYLELRKAEKQKRVYVALELKEERRAMCRLSCLLSKRRVKGKKTGSLSCERGANKQYSNEFVIDYFTINDSI